MRYLGLDYGSRTLGVSVSDETGLIASSVKTIRYNEMPELLEELNKIIEEYKIKEVVLGLPINLNGTQSVRSEVTLEFKKILEDNGLVVHLQDERLSTVEAERVLIGNNTRRKNRKKVIDSMAAVIILQTFLDKGNR